MTWQRQIAPSYECMCIVRCDERVSPVDDHWFLQFNIYSAHRYGGKKNKTLYHIETKCFMHVCHYLYLCLCHSILFFLIPVQSVQSMSWDRNVKNQI